MIFTQQLARLDDVETARAVRIIANHVRTLQEELEYTLTSLDSDNIIEIDTDRTSVASADGGTATGERILIKGAGSSMFGVSKLGDGSLVFRMTDNDGAEIAVANSAVGKFDVVSRAPLTLDCGTWDDTE